MGRQLLAVSPSALLSLVPPSSDEDSLARFGLDSLEVRLGTGGDLILWVSVDSAGIC